MKIFRRIINFLKKECPSDLPIKVRRTKLPQDLDGDCQKKSTFFLIRIDKELNEHEAIDTLVHEFSHALTWSLTQTHCNEWGKAYSRVYRILLKFIQSEYLQS